jgi:hypothetical protein
MIGIVQLVFSTKKKNKWMKKNVPEYWILSVCRPKNNWSRVMIRVVEAVRHRRYAA